MALAREGVTFAEARISMHAANESDFREMIDMAPRFSFTVSASALRKALSVRDHVYRRSDDNWLAFVACDRPGGRTLLVATLEGGDLRGAAVKSIHAIPDKSGGGDRRRLNPSAGDEERMDPVGLSVASAKPMRSIVSRMPRKGEATIAFSFDKDPEHSLTMLEFVPAWRRRRG